MRALLVLLVALLAGCDESMFDSAVQIGDGERTYCSGVVVAKDRVLTNAHCTAHAAVGVVTFRDGSTAPFLVLRSGADNKVDLALLGVRTHVAPVFLGVMPSVGDTVYAVGNPMGLGWSFSRGVVGYLNRVVPGFNGVYIQHDASIAGGSSGSGLFSRDGRLIGINTLAGPGMGFAVPIYQVIEFLELPTDNGGH